MPIPQWTATEFNQYYHARDEKEGSPTQGERFGYGREWATYGHMAPIGSPAGLYMFDQRWNKISTDQGIGLNDTILVVGCAFGFLVESAHRAGFANAWGVDSSPYCEADAKEEIAAGVDILWGDISADIAPELNALTGRSSYQWIILEDLDTCKDDVDVNLIAANCESYLDDGLTKKNILHLVTCIRPGGVANPTYPDMNWKTVEDWRLMVPTHSWGNLAGGEAAR